MKKCEFCNLNGGKYAKLVDLQKCCKIKTCSRRRGELLESGLRVRAIRTVLAVVVAVIDLLYTFQIIECSSMIFI